MSSSRSYNATGQQLHYRARRSSAQQASERSRSLLGAPIYATAVGAGADDDHNAPPAVEPGPEERALEYGGKLRRCFPRIIVWLQACNLLTLCLVWFLPPRIPIIIDEYDVWKSKTDPATGQQSLDRDLNGNVTVATIFDGVPWTPGIIYFFKGCATAGGNYGIVAILVDFIGWIFISVWMIRFFWNRTEDEAAANAASSLINCCAANCNYVIHWIQVPAICFSCLFWTIFTSGGIMSMCTNPLKLPFLGMVKHAFAISLSLASVLVHKRWKLLVSEQDDVREQFRAAYYRYFGAGKEGEPTMLDNAAATVAERWEALKQWAYYTEEAEGRKLEDETLSTDNADEGYLNALWDLWQRDPEVAKAEAEHVSQDTTVDGTPLWEWFAAWEQGEERPNLEQRRKKRQLKEIGWMAAEDRDASDFREELMRMDPGDRPDLVRRDQVVFYRGRFLESPKRRKNPEADQRLVDMKEELRENDSMKVNDKDVGDDWVEEHEREHRFRPRTDRCIYKKGQYLDKKFDPSHVEAELGAMDYFWQFFGYDVGEVEGAQEKEENYDGEQQEARREGGPNNQIENLTESTPLLLAPGPRDDDGSSPRSRTASPANKGGGPTRVKKSSSSSKKVPTRNDRGEPVLTLKDFSRLNQDRYVLDELVPRAPRQAPKSRPALGLMMHERDLSAQATQHMRRATETTNAVATRPRPGDENNLPAVDSAEFDGTESFDSRGVGTGNRSDASERQRAIVPKKKKPGERTSQPQIPTTVRETSTSK
ncbi:unnamed protein product [Amoebophrya sp. A120]|nr:unnamed protein product [Amoebophrya sp. A120]|eukprot:GSA120T00011313001.1